MERREEGLDPGKKEAAFDVENIEEVEKQVSAIRDILDDTGWKFGRKWSPEAEGHLKAALIEGEKVLEDLKKKENKE